MNTRFYTTILSVFAMAILLTGCYTEDPGALQHAEKQFNATGFDQLQMGDAFKITVTQSDQFEINASGDIRNIEDLVVENNDGKLTIKYINNRNRKHDTRIEIKMPTLLSVNFGGGSKSEISGFENLETLSINLHGASVCDANVSAKQIETQLSGASDLNLFGSGDDMTAQLSGASVMKAFHYPVETAEVIVSGASDSHVSVSQTLKAIASGASVVLYRGEPVVKSDISGSSSVRKDF